MCRQPVRPLPLQPGPVHKTMFEDQLCNSRSTRGGVGWDGGVSGSGSLTCHCFSASPKDMQNNKKKICSILHVILRRVKIRTIAISL